MAKLDMIAWLRNQGSKEALEIAKFLVDQARMIEELKAK
jgi:hypothetical protein